MKNKHSTHKRQGLTTKIKQGTKRFMQATAKVAKTTTRRIKHAV